MLFRVERYYGVSASFELSKALVVHTPRRRGPRWPSVAYALLKLLLSDHPDRLEFAVFNVPLIRTRIAADLGSEVLEYVGWNFNFWYRSGYSAYRAKSLAKLEESRKFWASAGVTRVAHITPRFAYVLEVVISRPVALGESLLSIPDTLSPEAWKNLGRDTEYLRASMRFLSKHLEVKAATGYMVKIGNKWLEYPSLPPEKRVLAAALIAAPNADIVVAEGLDTVLTPEYFRAFLDAASAAKYALVVAYTKWAAETAASTGWAVH